MPQARFWGAHPVLHAGHGAVGVAQRVRQPVDAVAGLPIPVESHSNSSTAEEEKHQRAEVKLKGKWITQGWWLQSHFPSKGKALPPAGSWGGADAQFAPVSIHSQQLSMQHPQGQEQNTTSIFHLWQNNENTVWELRSRNPASGSYESCHWCATCLLWT